MCLRRFMGQHRRPLLQEGYVRCCGRGRGSRGREQRAPQVRAAPFENSRKIDTGIRSERQKPAAAPGDLPADLEAQCRLLLLVPRRQTSVLIPSLTEPWVSAAWTSRGRVLEGDRW